MTSLSVERELRRRNATDQPSPSPNITITLPVNKLQQPPLPPIKPSTVLSPIKTTTAHGGTKRRSSNSKQDENATHKRRRVHNNVNNNINSKEDMFEHYQPWVIQTYGDSAKTKTITLRKYARILRTLRGEETNSVENSKFRFWVKAKGFRVGQPAGYVAKPADGIIGTQSLDGRKVNDDPPIYVPSTNYTKDGAPKEKLQLFKKVAVVENFFDIIYSVHVEMEGRAGKHAGQKRTYRAITETYAFLPREAVTRFLLGCTDCQRHPRTPSPITTGNAPPSAAPTTNQKAASVVNVHSNPSSTNHNITTSSLNQSIEVPPPSDSFSLPSPITAVHKPTSNHHRRHNNNNNNNHKLTTAHMMLRSPANHNNNHLKKLMDPPDIDFSLPITTTYLKHMRSLGYTDEDALKIDVEDNVSTPEPEVTDEEHFPGRNGDMRLPDDRDIPADDVAGLWTGYHNALGLKKSTPPGPREQSSPLLLSDRSLTQETGSVHDETSSSGNKEDEDDDEDESEDKIDPHQYDPERLKAFNMFVRLFVDENLDRIVPISKQPKEKIQAIIDSCTRQFPEFAERARKRIRTYLKSCRRNKRARDGNGAWDATRPTPAHLTSVQAEQILAQACENESHNAKRMRLGLEPVSQPLPLMPQSAAIVGGLQTETRPSSMDHYTSPPEVDIKPNIISANNIKQEPLHSVGSGLSPSFNPAAVSKSTVASVAEMAKSSSTSVTAANMNGTATSSSSAAPTALYRPNFTQAFQRAAATGPYPTPMFPTAPFGATGMISNGPTDLSMKTKPLLSHKLNTAEMAAVRQLITGYRESAAFLLRSADELEQLLLQQQ